MGMSIQPEELIAEYCDLDAVGEALFSGDRAAVRQAVDAGMRNILAEKPDNETLSLLVNCLFVVLQYHCFYSFLDRVGVTLKETCADRAAMCRDYAAWEQGEPLSDSEWLSDASEKERIFKAIEALHLHAADFDELPAPDLREPKTQKKIYGEIELVTIADAEITDDGGLFSDPDPVGKSYVLHDADGAVYYLNNIRKSEVPGGLDADTGRLFTADGRIDGYTGQTQREIEFELYDGGVIFTYITDESDAAATDDPRFAAYEQWAQSRMAGRRARQAAFLANYL